MVSIVIPCWNQMEYTQQCLESIQAYTPEDHEIIFVDNGSTDYTESYIKVEMLSHPNYKLLRNEENLGFPKACNQGANLAEGEYLLFLNNDVVVSKDWLTGLLDCIKSSSDIGCVGPMTNCISGRQQIKSDESYDTIFKYQMFAETYRKAHRGLYIPFYRIVGFCMLTKRELFTDHCGFDERFSPGNFEDDDYCLRLTRAGYRNVIAGDVFVHHHGTKSHDLSSYNDLLKTNQKKYEEKWNEIIGTGISAVMIVRDEESYIHWCLKNLSEQVDEIIVVDTGSKDATKALASEFPKVKIYDYEWCDDFSAARNFANSKATQPWILSIDADEVITGLDKINLHPWYAYRIETRNYTNNPRYATSKENTGEYPRHEKGKRWFPSTKARLFPNDPRIKFDFPVHEVVEDSCYYWGCGMVNCPDTIVHHYGRLNDNYEYGHGDKYYALLHKQLESGKNEKRSLEQLAIAAQGLGKYTEARDFWQKLLKIEPESNTAFLNMGHCYAEQGLWNEAREWSEKAVRASPESRDAQMNFATCLAMTGEPDKCIEICKDLASKYPDYPLPQSLMNALTIGGNNGN